MNTPLQTVPQSFDQIFDLRRSDNRPFVTYYRDGVKRSELSYADYLDLVQRCAQKIKIRLGDCSGKRVVVVMSNSDRQLIVFGALLLLGVAIVSVSPNELDAHVLSIEKSCGASLIISDRKVGSSSWDFDFTSWFAESGETSVAPSQLLGSDTIGLMVPTSGTTGPSKMVCLSHASLLANAQSLVNFHRLNSSSIHFCVLPLFHVNAFGFSFVSTLLAGGRFILCDRFHKEHFWNLISEEKAEIVSVVPEILFRLCQSAISPSNYEFPHLKYFVSAASALSMDLYSNFQERFGVKLIQGYGLSEAVNFSLVTPPDLSETVLTTIYSAHSRPPVGTPLDCNEVRIVADDSFAPLGRGVTGEIVVKGANVMSGYLDDSGATTAAISEGWLRTGDYGYFEIFEHDTPLYFVSGRKKNTAKRNGETILIEEVEDTLRTVEALGDLAVVSFPNSWTGEELGLVLLDSASLSEASVQEMIAELLPFFKRPKVVRFIDQIPRTASFKIQRRKLGYLFQGLTEVRFINESTC